MDEEKIIAVWDRMNPDSETKERMLQQIQSALQQEKAHSFKGSFKKFAIGSAASFILLLGCLGMAFRDYVHSLLFPAYTSDEFVRIDSGHMTGAFDKTDVLLSFLDRFNRSEFGNDITAIKENGYHYILFMKNENQLLAFVDGSVQDYCIVVYMERLEYENTQGIWQVTGYQILETPAAEMMQSSLEPYLEVPSEDRVSVPEEDTAIKGQGASVLIYNVNDKKNVATLSEDDGRILSGILDGCERQENISGGLFQYVVKVDGISYMFDSKGNGMIADSANHQGITLGESDMEMVVDLFKIYNVSLEEKHQ